METLARTLRERVADAEPRLRAMKETEVAPRPAPERWSKKEILGHLIDSACNNHQRVVRALLEGELAFPGYEQEGHAEADWPLLVELWAAYNRHLAALIERFPPDRLGAPCRIGGAEPVTLAALAEDYVRHLDHHLDQLWREAPAG